MNFVDFVKFADSQTDHGACPSVERQRHVFGGADLFWHIQMRDANQVMMRIRILDATLLEV